MKHIMNEEVAKITAEYLTQLGLTDKDIRYCAECQRWVVDHQAFDH